jgi:hypothetical protein
MLRLWDQSNFSNNSGPMALQNRRRNLGGSLCELTYRDGRLIENHVIEDIHLIKPSIMNTLI